jgi:hypothetical protein
MARSRNIKPGLFKNEILGVADPLYTLAFQGLWLIADREGRLEDRTLRIKAEIFPYRDGVDMDAMLHWLQQEGFILRYQATEKHFIQILNFGKHQNPHKNETPSEIPEPGESVFVPKKSVLVPSESEALGLIPDSLNLIPDSLSCSPSAIESAENGFATFWKQYPKKVAKPQALKAWKKIKPAGQLLADLMAALEKQKASADWLKDEGQFIPHPASWLNGRRWEDEAPPAADKTAAPARNPIFAGAI